MFLLVFLRLFNVRAFFKWFVIKFILLNNFLTYVSINYLDKSSFFFKHINKSIRYFYFSTYSLCFLELLFICLKISSFFSTNIFLLLWVFFRYIPINLIGSKRLLLATYSYALIFFITTFILFLLISKIIYSFPFSNKISVVSIAKVSTSRNILTRHNTTTNNVLNEVLL
jgi:hypothetical protein